MGGTDILLHPDMFRMLSECRWNLTWDDFLHWDWDLSGFLYHQRFEFASFLGDDGRGVERKLREQRKKVKKLYANTSDLLSFCTIKSSIFEVVGGWDWWMFAASTQERELRWWMTCDCSSSISRAMSWFICNWKNAPSITGNHRGSECDKYRVLDNLSEED